MKEIKFWKMQASGNDFILIDHRRRFIRNVSSFAQKWCMRRLGIGADGLLLIERSKVADIKFRIINPDGSEAQMCGNGARCVGKWFAMVRSKKKSITMETKAGIVKLNIKNKDKIRVRLSNPYDIKLGLSIPIKDKNLQVDFINTGVPHAVIFVEELSKIEVNSLGRAIRFHRVFMPEGANVNFVELVDDHTIKIRTYERGVEAETLSCGTGTVASAVIYRMKYNFVKMPVNVITTLGEKLKIYFDILNGCVENVFLEGRAKVVFYGVIKT